MIELLLTIAALWVGALICAVIVTYIIEGVRCILWHMGLTRIR